MTLLSVLGMLTNVVAFGLRATLDTFTVRVWCEVLLRESVALTFTS